MDIQTRDNLEHNVRIADAVERLRHTPDFKLLAKEMEKRQLALVNSIAGIVKRNESLNTTHDELKSLSFFNYFLNDLVSIGDNARDTLEQED